MQSPTADDISKISSPNQRSATNINEIQVTKFKMVSKRFDKITKKITKKKGKSPNLHEGSRDTQRLQSAAARDDKLNRLTSLREKQNRHFRMVQPIG
jgi:hypothetical protein